MIYQKLRPWALRAALLAVVCLVVMSMTTPATSIFPIAPPLEEDMDSGETLFRAIYFAEGPLADRIPEAKAFDIRLFVKDQDQLNGIFAFHNDIIADINQTHPNFFDQFAAAIASRNHYQIKTKIIEGNEIMVVSASKLTGTEVTQEQEDQFKADLEARVDVNSASADEISEALRAAADQGPIIIDQHTSTSVLLPVCLFGMCHVYLYIGLLDMYPEGLFTEELVNSVANL
jgi:SdpC family antimicrobial peptide